MKFKTLQENLRRTISERIDEGGLTGLQLAEQTGFKQAHISNFLNRKRGLSVQGMDKVLNVQQLSVLDLLDPTEINKLAGIQASTQEGFENVALVEGRTVIRPLVWTAKVKDVLKFKRSFLRKLRPEMEGDRDDWERFIVLRADARDGMSMYPRLLPGATLLIDRHYNSLKPYRKGESNMYAVLKNGACTIKYVEIAGSHLVLRPHNPAYPVEIQQIEKGKTATDYIVGRVCYVGIET